MERKNAQTLFIAIYEKEADALFRFCAVRISSREQAIDIAQETFLRFWKVLSEGTDVASPRPFLFKVARHLIIDWYRKKKPGSLEEMAESDGLEPDDISDKTATDIEIGAEGRFLADAIGSLPPTYRDAVYLRFVEDMSLIEIGEVLGISANAASVRLSRGLDELRKRTGYDDSALGRKQI